VNSSYSCVFVRVKNLTVYEFRFGRISKYVIGLSAEYIAISSLYLPGNLLWNMALPRGLWWLQFSCVWKPRRWTYEHSLW